MKQATLLIVLVVGLAVGLGFVLGGVTLGPGYDVDTRAHYAEICEGGPLTPTREAKGSGQYPSPAGQDSVPGGRGEVFSASKLWYAWFDSGDAQPITAEARMLDCPQTGFGFGLAADTVYYKWLYSEDGKTWVGFTSTPGLTAGVNKQKFNVGQGVADVALGGFTFTLHGNDFYPCPLSAHEGVGGHRDVNLAHMSCTSSTEPRDIVDGAALLVQVWVDRESFPSWGDGPQIIASDQVQLRSAAPRVWFDRGGYGVGDVALVNWEIPSGADSHGNAAYFLSVKDMNTNTAIAGVDSIPLLGETDKRLSGQTRVPITESMFSSDQATCQNYIRAEIWSQLIAADRDDATVRSGNVSVTAGGAVPNVTSVSFDKDRYLQGDTVTVTWTTSGDVTSVHVIALIGGFEILNEELPGTARSVSFPASTTGWLKAEVRVEGNGCEFSDFKKVFAPIGNPRGTLCSEFPDAKECSRDLDGLVPLIAAAIVLVVGLIVATGVGRGKPLWFLLIFLGFLAAAVYAYFALGGAG